MLNFKCPENFLDQETILSGWEADETGNLPKCDNILDHFNNLKKFINDFFDKMIPEPIIRDTVTVVKQQHGGVDCFVFESKDRSKAAKNEGKVLFYYHGGGWVLGSAEKSATYTCQFLAETLNVTVVSVEYSLGPEFTFSEDLSVRSAFPDCYNATKAYLDDFSSRIDRYGISGDSAGGNLALSVAIKMVNDKNANLPSLIAPIYPVTQVNNFATESYRNSNTPGINQKDMIECFLGYAVGDCSFEVVDFLLDNVDFLGSGEVDFSEDKIPKNHFEILQKIKKIANNQYASPLLASDDLYKKLLKNTNIYLFYCQHDVLKSDSDLLLEKLRKIDSKQVYGHVVLGGSHSSICRSAEHPKMYPKHFEALKEYVEFVGEKL